MTKQLCSTIIAASAVALSCTSHIVLTRPITIPIISAVEREDEGHIIRLYIQVVGDNLSGFHLYEGSTEEELGSRQPEDGIACGPLNILPNRARQYTIEVKGSATLQSNQDDRICAMESNLTPGSFAALRTVIQTAEELLFSHPSNAAAVP